MMLAAQYAGGASIIVPKFDAGGALEAIHRERVTMLAEFPPILTTLLDAAEITPGYTKPFRSKIHARHRLKRLRNTTAALYYRLAQVSRRTRVTKRHAGKTAIVSGAASGIGQASAIRLAQEGADIIIADRQNAETTLQSITEFGGKAKAFQCDVTNPASVNSFKAAVETLGARCDILLNNAGIYPMQTFDEMTFEDWRHVLSVNLNSMFLMTKAFIDGMQRRQWGRIINIASDTVNLVLPGFAHYVASKAEVYWSHAGVRD